MAHSYAASMEEELTCWVCFELFVDPHTPKELNCLHVICELCLNRLVMNSAIGCPQCRAITRVPKDDVAALRTNLGIRSLAEKHLQHLQEPESEPSSQSSPQNQVPICPDHGEKMHFYCTLCDIFVCHACIVVNHTQPEHHIQDVKVLRREQMIAVDAKISTLEQDALTCEQKSHKIGGTEREILSSIKAEEEKIDQAVALLVEKAYEQSDVLKAEIRSKNDLKLQQCQVKKGSLQKQAHDLWSAAADTRELADVTSSHEFVAQHKALMDKLKAIPGCSDEGLVQYQSGEVEFQAEQLTLKLGTVTLQQSEKGVVKKRKTAGLVRGIRESAQMRGCTESINSIASNATGNILAISEGIHASNKHVVRIYYKQSNGNYRKQTVLKVTGSQFDGGRCYVTIAADGKYLLANGRSIHAYSTSRQYLKVCYTAPKLVNNTEARLTGITTLEDGRIITGDYARSVITIHTPSGAVTKTINTSLKPRFITAINNTRVAISQHTANRVCVIDLESEKETLSIDVDRPLAVCHDEEANCLLVGTMEGVIDQYFLSTGDKIARIEDDLGWPNAMTITGDGKLAVGTASTVKIYSTSF